MTRPEADLHVHTIASGHAYSTLSEIVVAARARGISLVGLLDHGPGCPGGAHAWHFWNMRVLPSVIDGVRILKGVEANLSPDSENGIDLPDEVLERLDLVAVGFHPCTGFDGRDRSRNTEALLRVMDNPLVDMVTHPGNEDEFPLDVDAVVDAAARLGIIIELNDHSFDELGSRGSSALREREFALAAYRAGAPIAVSSDAHFALHVGRFDSAMAAADEIGIPGEAFVNRTACGVVDFLSSRRERPFLDHGGAWDSSAARRVDAGGDDSW